MDLPTFWAEVSLKADDISQRADASSSSLGEPALVSLRASVEGHLASSPDDLPRLRGLLSDTDAGHALARIFLTISWMPENLFAATIAEGLRRPMEQVFVRACIASFGYERVIDTLLDAFSSGSTSEKINTSLALYWAEPPIVFAGADDFLAGKPTHESLAVRAALAEVLARRHVMLRREYDQTSDTQLRSALERWM